MLMDRIIPCLDVRDGRVVKGVRFEGLRDVGDPVDLALEYAAAGADEIAMLDVTATIEGRATLLDVVASVRDRLSIPLTVGGGVRTVEDAGRLLAVGADKVAVNSAAVVRPELISELAERFGRQCVVVSVDAIRREPFGWETVIAAGSRRTGLSAVDWSTRAVSLGAGEILLTSHDRDGTGEGYDLDLVRAVSDSVPVPVIASGGARNSMDLAAALEAGASAALLAGVLHDRLTTIHDIRRDLSDRGRELRPC